MSNQSLNSDVVIVKCRITQQIPYSVCHIAKVNIELLFTISTFFFTNQ
jgi:hypothetical protein